MLYNCNFKILGYFITMTTLALPISFLDYYKAVERTFIQILKSPKMLLIFIILCGIIFPIIHYSR
jgi:hypothetical protein